LSKKRSLLVAKLVNDFSKKLDEYRENLKEIFERVMAAEDGVVWRRLGYDRHLAAKENNNCKAIVT